MRPALMELIDNKTINILDIDPNKAEGVLQRTRELHNRIAHSNDLLIFSNASACDYLVTDDTSLTAFAPDDAPIVLNAEQFLARVLSQP